MNSAPSKRTSWQKKKNVRYVNNNTQDKKDSETKLLKKQFKREMKGAIRELRKDSQFIQVEKSKKRKLEEEETNRKRRRVMSILQQDNNQQKSNKNNNNNNKKKGAKAKTAF